VCTTQQGYAYENLKEKANLAQACLSLRLSLVHDVGNVLYESRRHGLASNNNSDKEGDGSNDSNDPSLGEGAGLADLVRTLTSTELRGTIAHTSLTETVSTTVVGAVLLCGTVSTFITGVTHAHTITANTMTSTVVGAFTSLGGGETSGGSHKRCLVGGRHRALGGSSDLLGKTGSSLLELKLVGLNSGSLLQKLLGNSRDVNSSLNTVAEFAETGLLRSSTRSDILSQGKGLGDNVGGRLLAADATVLTSVSSETLTLTKSTDTLSIDTTGFTMGDRTRTVLAHPSLLTDTLHALGSGHTETVIGSRAVVLTSKTLAAVHSSESRLTGALAVSDADTVVLVTSLGAMGGFGTVLTSVVGIAETLSVKAASVTATSTRTTSGGRARGALESGVAEAHAITAETTSLTVVLAGNLGLAVGSSKSRVAFAVSLAGRILQTATLSRAHVGTGFTLLLGVERLTTVGAIVARETAALSKDADTALRTLVGTRNLVDTEGAVFSAKSGDTGASTVETDTRSRASVGTSSGSGEEGLESLAVPLRNSKRSVGASLVLETGHRLVALVTNPSVDTLALSAHTDTLVVTVTLAHVLASVTRSIGVAVAAALDADTVSRAGAVSGASLLDRASESSESSLALALSLEAVTMSVTELAVGALGTLDNLGTVFSKVTIVALADTVVTHTLSRAVVGTLSIVHGGLTSGTTESRVTEALTEGTETTVVTILGTLGDNVTLLSSETGVTEALSVRTLTTAITLLSVGVGALHLLVTVVTTKSGVAKALSVLAHTVTVAVSRAALDRAIFTLEASLTRTHSTTADSVSTAVGRTGLLVAVVVTHKRTQQLLTFESSRAKLSRTLFRVLVVRLRLDEPAVHGFLTMESLEISALKMKKS